ncbi:hypothetical protein CYMTET_11166, partial [Cymbomonas tetramitiformis]
PAHPSQHLGLFSTGRTVTFGISPDMAMTPAAAELGSEHCCMTWGGGGAGALLYDLGRGEAQGALLHDLEAEKGHWRSSRSSTYFVDCAKGMDEALCLGGVGAGEGSSCQEGHEGPLCGVCHEDWRVAAKECVQCNDQGSTIGSYFLMAAIVLILPKAFLNFVRYRTNQVRERIQRYGPAWSADADIGVITKSYLSYLQMMGMITEVHVEWNSAVQWLLDSTDAISSGSAYKIEALSCLMPAMRYLQQYILMMAAPVVAFVVPGIVVIALYTQRILFAPDVINAERIKRTKAHYSNAVVFLIFILYPTVVRRAVEVFKCVRVSDSSADTEERYLVADLSMDCNSDEYEKMSASAAVFCTAYGLGIPVLLFIILYQYRNKLEDEEVRVNLEFTYLGYKRHLWWWECLQLCRKLVLAFTMVIYRSNYYMQLLLTLACTDCFLSLTLSLRPYTNSMQNAFEIVQLITIAGTLQCSLLFVPTTDDDGEDDNQIKEWQQLIGTSVILILNIAVNVFFVAAATICLHKDYGDKVADMLHAAKQKGKRGSLLLMSPVMSPRSGDRVRFGSMDNIILRNNPNFLTGGQSFNKMPAILLKNPMFYTPEDEEKAAGEARMMLDALDTSQSPELEAYLRKMSIMNPAYAASQEPMAQPPEAESDTPRHLTKMNPLFHKVADNTDSSGDELSDDDKMRQMREHRERMRLIRHRGTMQEQFSGMTGLGIQHADPEVGHPPEMQRNHQMEHPSESIAGQEVDLLGRRGEDPPNHEDNQGRGECQDFRPNGTHKYSTEVELSDQKYNPGHVAQVDAIRHTDTVKESQTACMQNGEDAAGHAEPSFDEYGTAADRRSQWGRRANQLLSQKALDKSHRLESLSEEC